MHDSNVLASLLSLWIELYLVTNYGDRVSRFKAPIKHDIFQDVWSVVLHCKDRPLEHLAQFELPASKHRWASAAAFTQDRSLVICGDRAGSVLLYDMVSQFLLFIPKKFKYIGGIT